jgi:hypothetical protein
MMGAQIHDFEASAPELPAPLWARLLGKRRKDSTYRFNWAEISTSRCGIALSLGCYGRPHLNIAIVVGQIFFYLPMALKPLFPSNCEGDRSRFGFSTTNGDLHVYWGHRYKIFWRPWNLRHEHTDVLASDGEWATRYGHGMLAQEIPALWQQEWPFHYMTNEGEAQHVTATCTRRRTVYRRTLFGLPLWLLPVQHSLHVSFSEEVGNRRGSWKGGTVGCSIEMKPGEEPRWALRRMQATQRFCR